MRTDERPCPFCGGTAYVWGEVRAQGLRFVPEDAGWLAVALGGGFSLRARRCESCGNVQIFDVSTSVALEEGSSARVSRVPDPSQGSTIPLDLQIERASESLDLGLWTTPLDAWLVERIGEEGGFLLTGGTLAKAASGATYRRFDPDEVRALADRLVGIVEVEPDALEEEMRGFLSLLVELVMGAAEVGDAVLVELASRF